MYTLLVHSHLPTCEECKAFVYDLKSGQVMEKGGEPVPRQPATLTPCHECPKLTSHDRKHDPRPANAVEATARTKQTYLYYRHCEIDKHGYFPVDPLVLESNAICRMAEEDAREANAPPFVYLPMPTK